MRYGQTAGHMEMPLGMGVGLGQDHIVLDGDNSLLKCRGFMPLKKEISGQY